MSQAEIEAEKRASDEREASRAAAERDAVLLSTYLSVDEIEALRNRRIELIQGQISLTENYLHSLTEKLQKLQTEAGAFKPYSQDPDAEPIDAALAQELSDTLDSIALYEKTLTGHARTADSAWSASSMRRSPASRNSRAPDGTAGVRPPSTSGRCGRSHRHHATIR